MSPREKGLFAALMVILVGGGSLFVGIKWFWEPLKQVNASIQRIKDEIHDKDEKIFALERDRKKMELVKRKSLPANSEAAGAEYIHYLKPLLEQSKLIVDEVNPFAAAEIKPSGAIPNIKKIGHQTKTFQVRARGELAALVTALEKIQNTPYLHRIKSLNIDREEISTSKSANSRLVIVMTLETLLYARTESKPGIPPGIDPKYLILDGIAARQGVVPLGWGLIGSTVLLKQSMPTPENRDYADIAKKNIFVGALPAPPPVKKPVKVVPPVEVVDPGPMPPKDNMLAFIHVVNADYTQQEAYLCNRYSNAKDMKLVADPKSTYHTAGIVDDETGYKYFVMKTLRIDPRVVYFQVKDKVYRLQMDQTLADAMATPLSATERKTLQLDRLYDQAWADRQMMEKKGGGLFPRRVGGFR